MLVATECAAGGCPENQTFGHDLLQALLVLGAIGLVVIAISGVVRLVLQARSRHDR
ncbi:MAG: hypothetical protein JO291_10710 [Acidimicrobiia bacterium]|nr:hypothetical protein [Acidimicrobiia bacterium]